MVIFQCFRRHDYAYARCKGIEEGMGTLVKLYSTNTTTLKMQLKQELHNVHRNKLSINEYAMKLKALQILLAQLEHLLMMKCVLEWFWERICTISDIHWSP